MSGLSFREFLNFEHGYKMEALSLDEILSNHVEIALEVGKHMIS